VLRLLVPDIPSKLQHEGGFQEVEEAVFIQVTAHVNTLSGRSPISQRR
jgi:hypothetical protein